MNAGTQAGSPIFAAVLVATRHPEEIILQRSVFHRIRIPANSVRAIRTEMAMAGTCDKQQYDNWVDQQEGAA